MATEFNKLVGYLRKMGLTYSVQAADGYNKISYTDDQGNDAQVEYTKVITIDSPESAKTHYPKIDLWYIPSLDRFVEHGSATNGETNALQADTAKDILDYIGYVYWEMSEDEMKKQLESKKNEDSARPYMNRLYCLVEQGYLDWATIGEYLARGLSEDMVEKAYGWMKQDELIPTDDALAEDGLEWDEDGELVSIETDESKKKEAFNSYNDIEDFVKEHVSYRALADDITQMGIAAKSLAKKYNLDGTRGPSRIKLRNKIRDEIEKTEDFEQAKAHILRIVDAIVDEDRKLGSIE